MDIPDDFRCPISLEIMTDPVILTSGHTFDRVSIQRWLDAGNLTCPLTNLTLTRNHSSPILTPNLAIRRLIQYSLFTPPLTPNSLPYPSDPQALSSLLKSIQKSAEFRQKVAESNLVRSLLRHVADQRRPEAQRLAIHSVLYLSLDGDDVKVGLVAEGAVDSLITAINSNSAAASSAAATAITSLATVDVNKVTIGAHPSAISSLSSMLLEGLSKREKKEAATAIYQLCKFPENRRRVVRVGAVRSLVRLAGSGLDRAIEILVQLAKVKEGREEMGKDPEFVRVLIGVMRSGTSRGVESAILVMTLVCGEEKMSSEAVNNGILEVLEKLGNGESGKIAKNAMGLLKRLRREEF